MTRREAPKPDRPAGRRAGRPPVYRMPERIPDTPENALRAVLNTPPLKRDEWDYMREHGRTGGKS